MKAVILAGGSGTRLWPLSRRNYPKQFLKLNGDKSLLQQTVERLSCTVKFEDIIVITNNNYKFHVLSDLHALNLEFLAVSPNIILEPASRNTAPAVALSIKYCLEKLGSSDDEVLFLSPSDHIIKPNDEFAKYTAFAKIIAEKGYIVTFGIKPAKPETGYGYIKVKGDKLNVGSGAFCRVDRFVEKPDIKTAQRYLEEGDYYWNSGMFAFTIGTMLKEFEKHAPKISGMLAKGFDEMLSDFVDMPDISLDYAVAEKSKDVAVIPLDLYWNDIGSWDSLCDVMDKDEDGNIRNGDVIAVDTKNTMIMGGKRLISTIGLKDCLIVETDDAVLIAKKGETQKVKEIVGKLKADGRKEADEHITTYRPWGSYTVLEEGERYKIKRIVVNPNERLSLQMHYHRSEHWVVVKGTAQVTVGDMERIVHENESAYVPKSTVHKLENPGKVPLEIIEVQNGEYVGEDDIVRFNDLYGRK